jgi:predicted acyltransferase (DUF342 family)
MSNNSWKQYGGISKTDNFNTINASTIIADQFISRSTRPTYQFFNGTYEVAYDLSAGVNLLAGNSIYAGKDIFANRNLYTNNKLFFGNNTFLNDGNNFPALSTPNTYAYMYGNSSNIGVNTILPKTVFNITGTVGSATDILTVESGNVYIRNIIAQNVNKRGIVVDADDVSSNILFYNDVSTDKPNVPDAKIKYEDGGILTTRTTNLILTSARTVQMDTSGGQLVMNSTKTALTSSGYLSMDISGNISLKGGSNIVLDISRSKLTFNQDKSIVVDTSNEFIVNYPSGNLILNGNGSKIDSVKDVTILSRGVNNAGGNIILDTSGGSIKLNAKELLLNAKLKFSTLDRTILNFNAYDETITVFDNSQQTFLHNIYKDDSVKYGHSINCVGIDGSASTFIHMTPVNTRQGGTIGGGVAPYDTTRSITMIGTTDISGNYNNSLMTVSGKNTHKYLSTVGINTFQPKTENYALDVNGAMSIGNGEINEIIRINFEIKHVSIAKAPYSNYGIAVGCPKTSVTNNDPIIQSYQQVLLYTTNGGKTWNQSNAYQLSATTDDVKTIFYNCFMLNNTYGIVSGENGYIFITNNSGVSWYRLILVNQSNVPISTEAVIQTAVIVKNASRLIMTYKIIGSSSTTGIYFFDVASLSTLFTSASNNNIRIIPDSISIGQNVQPNSDRTTGGFVISSTSVSNAFSYFAGDGIARYKNAALAVGASYATADAYTIKTTTNYYSISAFDDTHAIAVGSNKISSTVDGITWTHKTTIELGLGNIVLNSVVACDASNAIAIGSQGELIYSYNWGNTVPMWAFVPDSILNTSGAKKMLLTGAGHLQNICMVELSAFIIVNVIRDFVDGVTDLADVAGESKILYCYLPNLFNNLNNNVLDVSGSIAITGQVKVYNGELLINTVNSNADNKPEFDARTLNIGSKTHIVNIGFNDDKSLIEQELRRDFDVGSSVINIGVVDPNTPDSSAVLINIGNYNSSKTNRKSNLINIGGGNDITSIGGTVLYSNNALITSRGKGIQINDFNLGLAISTYIAGNSNIYNTNFLPNAVFLPNIFYFIYDFRSNPFSNIRSYLNNNVVALISGYINLKNTPTIVYTPTKLPAGITATYVGNTITTGSYDLSKYNVDFESYVLDRYISYYLTTYNIAMYTVNTDTNIVEVSVSGTVTPLGILYTSYPNYYYPVPFDENGVGYDTALESHIKTVYKPFRTSKGAGIFVADNTDRQAGHIRVSEDMNGWVMKPTNPNSNVVKFDVNSLTLSNNLSINPNLGVYGIKSGLVVLNRPTGTDVIDSSYVLSVKQFDISNILVRDSTDSTDNQQVIKTNVLIGNTLAINNRLYVANSTLLNGDASFNGKLSVGRDVSLNGKLTVASDVSINGNITINGTLESTIYQSNYIINTVTNDYEFIVTTDMSMSGNLFVKGDVSFNSDIDIKGYIAVGKSNPVVSVDISYTDAIRIPTGTTIDRPIDYNGSGTLVLKNNVPLASPTDKNKYIGAIRYNTDNKQFEGFGPAESWASLGSVSNISQNTTIVAASPNPGSTNNDLMFFTANKNKVLISDKLERMRIDGSGNVGIGTIAPECTFHVDISNNTEDNTTAGLFTNSNLKPTYNVDIENTININIASYIDAYKGTAGYLLTGITGSSVSNYAYDYYYNNTHFEDFAIRKYIVDRDFRIIPPYGTYLYPGSSAYTYGFGGPYDVSYNQDIEMYVRNNIHAILTSKAQILDALGDPNLNLNQFNTPVGNGYFTNPFQPGIYVYKSGTTAIYSYYDFPMKTTVYDTQKSYLYEGYYNYITANNTSKSIYSIVGTLALPFGVDSSGSRIRYTFIDNCSVVVGNDNKRSNNAANIIYSYLSNQNNKSALSFGFTQNENKMIIRADGKVGIGTTTPSSILTVQGDAFVTSRLFITNDVSMNNRLYVANDVSFANNLQVTNNVVFNNRLYVANDVDIRGYVAIGKSNPVVALDISYTDAIRVPSGTTAQRPISKINDNYTDENSVSISTTDKNRYIGAIRYNTDNNEFEGFGPSNDWSSLSGLINLAKNTKIIASFPAADSSNNDLMFYTAPKGNLLESSAVERMRITASGDVYMNNRLYVLNDVSLNNKLYVDNDVSFNNRLYVSNNVTFNADLLVKSDVSINGVLQVDSSANFSNTLTLKKPYSISDPIGLNVIADVSFNGNLLLQNDFVTNGDIYCTRSKDITLFDRIATTGINYANVINFGRYAKEINIMNVATSIGGNAYSKVINIGYTAPSATVDYPDKINITGKTILTGDTSINGNFNVNGTDATFSSGNITFISPLTVKNIAITGVLTLPGSTLTLNSLNITDGFSIGTVADYDLKFVKNSSLHIRKNAKIMVDGDIQSNFYNGLLPGIKESLFFHVQSATRRIFINTMNDNIDYNTEYMSIDSNVSGNGFIIFKPKRDTYLWPIFMVKGTQVAIGKSTDNDYANRMLDVSGDVYISKNLDISGSMTLTGKSIITGPVGIGTSNPRVILDISDTGAICIPVGTVGQRPTTAGESTHAGYIRYNITNHQFEGYGPGSSWGSLGGVINVAQNTKIIASSPNADSSNNDLMFFTAPAYTSNTAIERMRITSSGRIGIGTTNPSVILDISDTAAIRIPVGKTGERPTATQAIHAGYIRYNTDNQQFEGFGPGNSWGSLGGVINVSKNTKIMASSPNADSTNNDLMFFTAPAGTSDPAIERMRITSSGDVSMNAKLFVGGGVVFENNLYMKNNYTLYAKNSSGTADDAVFLPRGTNNDTYLKFGTGGFYIRNNVSTDIMFMSSTGNVGIGTTDPKSKLDVSGSVAIGSSYAGEHPAPANGLLVQGGVCIGKPSINATYALDVSGNVQANTYNALSDFRLKTNIQSLSGSLDIVNQLNGVSFTWKSDTTNKPVLGLIAQEVEKVLPDIVNTATADNELGYKQKSIHYDGLFPHLIESIKTLTQENKALSAKVDQIMTILDKLNISV